jgi:hypothetical protein
VGTHGTWVTPEVTVLSEIQPDTKTNAVRFPSHEANSWSQKAEGGLQGPEFQFGRWESSGGGFGSPTTPHFSTAPALQV